MMFRGSVSRAQGTARWTGVVAATAALGVVLAGCGSSGGSSATPTPSAPASPTVSAAEAKASQKALDAYNGYVATLDIASKTADADNPDFRKYIGDPLLGDTIYSLSQMNKAGLVQVGKAKYESVVSQVLLDQPVKTVIITACVDATDVKLVFKATGSAPPLASPNASKRTKVTAEAVRYDDGRWLVRKSTKIQGAPC